MNFRFRFPLYVLALLREEGDKINLRNVERPASDTSHTQMKQAMCHV